MEIRPGTAGKYKLRDEAPLAHWPTATVGDARNAMNAGASRSPDSAHHSGITLVDTTSLAGWGTPLANDKVRSLEFSEGRHPNLLEGSNLASWPTPTSSAQNCRSVESRPETGEGYELPFRRGISVELDDVGRPGPTNGEWGHADWLFCRDGKWRPAKSLSQPLAYGHPEGMGGLLSNAFTSPLTQEKDPRRTRMLKAYGNGLCLPQAAAFVSSVADFLS